MKRQPPSNVHGLKEARERRDSRTQFDFTAYQHDPTRVGEDASTGQVCLVVDPIARTGLMMSRDDAIALALSLIQTAQMAELRQGGRIKE